MLSQVKNTARAVAVVVGAAYAFALHQAGFTFDNSTRTALGLAPVVVVAAIFAFDLFLWKTPLLSKYLGKPRVYGTWLVTLTPRADSHIPPGGDWGPIKGAVVIEQTFWSTSVHLYTGESESKPHAVQFVSQDGSKERQRLVYTYANTPKQEHQGRSHPHDGAAELSVIGSKPDTMTGVYWTARLTAGDMTLKWLDKKTDYADLAAIRAAAGKANIDWA